MFTNTLFSLALNIVLSALQSSIKNPASLEKEYAILTEIRDILNQLIPPQEK